MTTPAAPAPTPHTASSSSAATVTNDAHVPQSVLAIYQILKSMGVKECEPRVIEQLLEFVHRYVSDVLVDSQVYMRHANREQLDLEDVKLAIQSRLNFSFSEPPPVEYLLEIANAKNREGFLMPESPCVMLPPEHLCLTNRNYQLSASNDQDDIADGSQQQQQRYKRARR